MFGLMASVYNLLHLVMSLLSIIYNTSFHIRDQFVLMNIHNNRTDFIFNFSTVKQCYYIKSLHELLHLTPVYETFIRLITILITLKKLILQFLNFINFKLINYAYCYHII